MSARYQRTGRKAHQPVYQRLNTRRIHELSAMPADIQQAQFDARVGSERLLERQIRAGCVMPEAMIRWQQRHGAAA